MLASYLLLFASAFLAATVLPFYSEVTLFLLLREGESPTLLLIVATLGNTLGSVVNWILGRYLLHYVDRPWFYFSKDQIARGQRWFQRRGMWSLLFAWLPLGGDVLTLIAGIMRVPLRYFVILVGVGKGLRYLAVIFLTQHVPAG